VFAPEQLPPDVTPSPEVTIVVPCYNEVENIRPLAERLNRTLSGIHWEAIFVDDDSPDGTAAEVRQVGRQDARLRCIRRVGRRGLSSAVIEGAMAASGHYVGVIDADLQHDEAVLLEMLRHLRAGECDVVVASRHIEGGDAEGLDGVVRVWLSELGTRVAQWVLPVKLTDPMSGCFMLERALFERLAPKLTGRGFKILLDLLLASPSQLRVQEAPCRFAERQHGESKLDTLVVVQFAGVLLDKSLHGLVPLRFIAFALVGGFGLLVHLAVLNATRGVYEIGFASAQTLATIVAMVVNFQLNNRLTYGDQRLRGKALWRGLALFMAGCGLGAVGNIGIANLMYQQHAGWTPAGAAGAAIGLVWNYAVSSTLVWRRR
jgi:dolichol-phosphate mannosyltransferase